MGKKEKIAEIQYNSGTTNQKLLSTIEKVSLEKIAAELKQQYKKLHKQMGPDSEENLSGEVWDNLKVRWFLFIILILTFYCASHLTI